MGVYGWSTGNGGVHFHRLAEPLRVAGEHGILAETGNRMDDAVAARHDTVLVHMLWDEANSEAWEKLAANGQHRLIFDIDDVMWAPDWEPFQRHYTPEVMKRVYRNIEMAHIVTTPSEVIAEHVASWNPNVHVVPNTVPEYLLRIIPQARPRPVVGFQGSASHDPDFSPRILRELVRFLDHNHTWDLHLWGKKKHEVSGWPPGRVKVTDWQASLREYYKSLSMDIGIGPLKPSLFNSGKSSLRAVEYAALGIPAILSDERPYQGWVEHGVTGLLLKPGDSWLNALNVLARDRDARVEMGVKARRRAKSWTTEANIGRWVEAWNSVGDPS